MTLNDFFTPTEMNNGLATPSRVRALISLMEKERNCTNSGADSTRQRSAVARAIVATNKKDCLDLFVQLDGLEFISKWLKEANECSDDEFCCLVEESIHNLLRALQKLNVDHEKLLASGIWETIENLQVHNNLKVRDKARALFESWKIKTDSITSITDVEESVDKPGKSDDIERGKQQSKSPSRDASICRENSVNTKGRELDNNVGEISKLPIADEGSLNRVNSSSLQKSTMETPLSCPVNPSQDILNTHREFPGSESSKNTKIESLSDKVGSLEASEERPLTSSSLVVKGTIAISQNSQTNSTAGGKESQDEGFSCIDTTEIDANGVKHNGDGSNQSHSNEASPKEVVNDANSLDESRQTKEESEHQDVEQTNGIQDVAISQLTESAQEEANEEKEGLCKFDLNQEDCSEVADLPNNQFSAPVSFVSASPHQMQEIDKDKSIGGFNISSKQRLGGFEIDLNVSESVDPRDLKADKQVHFFPTDPSGESSRRSEHLTMDLNHSSEDSALQLDWQIGQFFPSRSHSSVPSKQTIDLNDRVAFLSDPSLAAYLNQTFGAPSKPDDSVISIMGKKVEVNRQSPQLPNGRTANLLGLESSPSFPHSPIYGYSIIAPTPPVPFPYGSGGPIPYTMDSRGQHLFPQIMDSSSSPLPNAYSQLNMSNSAPSNGIGSSRSSFDLDPGVLSESGSREPAGFGLFLNSAQEISSVSNGKRKEPENGWENYPFRHYTPPWKQS